MDNAQNNSEFTEDLSVDDILSDPELTDLLTEEPPQPAEPASRESAHADKKKNKRIIYYCLLTVFVGMFLFSACYLGWYMIQSISTANSYTSVADPVASIRESVLASIAEEATNPNATGSGNSSGETGTDEGGILPEYRDVAAQNEDMVGWIRIDGVGVDYPVTQSPYEANFYLTHDFYKKENRFGCIYARETCDVFTPSDNVILYGHHMADGSMFGSLEKFESKSFWEKHQYIQFDTLYERHTYQIIAVGKTSANIGEGFPYYQFINASTEAELKSYVNSVKGLSFYDTGLSAEYGDMLLTLITCEYTLENGRMIILAKRVA